MWISYGSNNRTQMLRIPGPGRIEDRTIDGSANPYLAAAAVLAAGLDGLERRLEPDEPNAENLYPHAAEDLASLGLQRLPAGLHEAIDERERDEVLRSALGRGRGGTASTTTRVKREVVPYHEQVTPWGSAVPDPLWPPRRVEHFSTPRGNGGHRGPRFP